MSLRSPEGSCSVTVAARSLTTFISWASTKSPLAFVEFGSQDSAGGDGGGYVLAAQAGEQASCQCRCGDGAAGQHVEHGGFHAELAESQDDCPDHDRASQRAFSEAAALSGGLTEPTAERAGHDDAQRVAHEQDQTRGQHVGEPAEYVAGDGLERFGIGHGHRGHHPSGRG